MIDWVVILELLEKKYMYWIENYYELWFHFLRDVKT